MLTRLEITNFRSVTTFDSPLGSSLTVVSGKNDTGKSSVLDALRWGICGTTRGTDAKGVGIANLHSGGKQPMSVRVTLQHADNRFILIERTFTPATRSTALLIGNQTVALGPGQRAIEEFLGAKTDVLEVLLHAEAFLSAHHAEARALLLRVLEVKVPSFDANESPITALECEQRHKAAFDQRTDVNRRIKVLTAKLSNGLEKPEPLPDVEFTPADLEVLEEDFALLQNELTLKEREDAMSRGETFGRQAELVKSLAGAQADLQRVREQLAFLPDRRLDLEKAERELEAIRGEADAWKQQEGAEIDSERAKLVDVQGRLTMIGGSVDAMARRGDGPECVLGMGIRCDTPIAAFGEVTTNILEDQQAAEKTLKTIQAKLTKLATRQTAHQTRQGGLPGLQRQVADLLSATERRTAVLGQEKDLGKDITRLAESLNSLPADPAPDPALVALRERVEKGKTTLTEARRHVETVSRTSSDRQELATLQAALTRLEASIAHYGPSGAPVKALTAAVVDFEAHLNATLRFWGYSVQVFSEPWQILVNGHDLGLVAESVRHRVGIAIALTLAEMTDVRLVAIDRADVLDEDSRGRLMDLLLAWPGQSIVASTRDQRLEPMVDGDTVVVWLERDDKTRGTKVHAPIVDGVAS